MARSYSRLNANPVRASIPSVNIIFYGDDKVYFDMITQLAGSQGVSRAEYCRRILLAHLVRVKENAG